MGQVAQAGQAPSGTYVHVHDGAVALAQGGEEVVLTQGETALAPMDGGVPRKVRNGVRVASSGALGLPATIHLGTTKAEAWQAFCDALKGGKGGE